MPEKKILTITVASIIVLFVICFAFFVLLGDQNNEEGSAGEKPKTLVEKIPGLPEGAYVHPEGKIFVTSPKKNDIVANTFTVQGMARGFWFFEASFPVSVIDATGAVVGQGVAKAEGDWMTENFVPFTVEISLSQTPASSVGMLRLSKDDPSGENADSLDMPIRFND
ncbi:MAG: hypothetical protein FGM57_01930 [Candidatus Taylorbacteria bacterium]|nr:hypothetical protein [Candidatus Taylorbacteria bacterium]